MPKVKTKKSTTGKHFCISFKKGEDTGTGKRKVSRKFARNVVKHESNVKMRKLAEECTDIYTDSTLLIEYDTEVSELSLLRQEIASLKLYLKEVVQVTSVSHFIAIRTFSDLLLQALYDMAGKGEASYTERVTWLDSHQCEMFMNRAVGTHLPFAMGLVNIQPGMCTMFRGLRMLSKRISTGHAHSSSAVNIALALDKKDIKAEVGELRDMLNVLFKGVLGIEPAKLRAVWSEGECDKKYTNLFFLPKIAKEKG